MLPWQIHGFTYASAGHGVQANLQKAINSAPAVAVVKFAFPFPTITRLQIHCTGQNTRSAALAKQLGFVYRETVSDDATFDDVYVKERSVPCGERQSACQS